MDWSSIIYNGIGGGGGAALGFLIGLSVLKILEIPDLNFDYNDENKLEEIVSLIVLCELV